jgi:hypothetical protein
MNSAMPKPELERKGKTVGARSETRVFTIWISAFERKP